MAEAITILTMDETLTGAPALRDNFERLVRDHARVMAAAIRRVCGRRYQALVPDVQQEVYLALWNRLQKGGVIRHPTSYLYKMSLTTALAMVRRLSREAELTEDPPQSPDPPRPGDLAPVERRRLAEQVLERLPDEPRRAVSAYLAGFNHREVALLYGWSESRSRHLIYRSIERLKRALPKEAR